ncbi:MAG: glycosyltransferase family protein [Solirubrobacterales bacterium]
MKILYGVNGEGMGHATRSELVISSLLENHEVRIRTSGAAYGYLDPIFENVDEIFGPSFAMDQGEILRWASVTGTLSTARRELPGNVTDWMASAEEWKPDVVITDFEPLSGIYARLTRTPLICVDNIHMIDRCRHDRAITHQSLEDFGLAKTVTRAMVPHAGDYVIPTFFRPEVIKARTSLVPPILRTAILESEPTRGDHLVVYSGGGDELIDTLRDAPMPVHLYGMRDGDDVGTTDGAITYQPRSIDGFLEDLVTSGGVITGGGFSLLSEAVYLGKPVLSMPLKGQFEQLMNAYYLEREGYGTCATQIDGDALQRFLGGLDDFHEKLADYSQDGNKEALEVITRTVEVAADQSRRERARARREARKAPR